MDATPLVRLRWRLRGAWLWPAWVALSLADGVIVKELPLSGDSGTFVGGVLLGAVFGLIGIALLGRSLGRIVRAFRPDMPRVVARNYGAVLMPVIVTLTLLTAGLLHQSSTGADSVAYHEAVARADAYIDAHAPVGYRTYLSHQSVYEIQGRASYRVCASDSIGYDYCVVVDLWQPFATSVHPAGAEPNSELAQGTS